MQLDDDEAAYHQPRFFEKPIKESPSALTIFLCVLAAIMASWGIKAAYEEWQVRRALAAFNQQMQAVQAQAKAQTERINAQIEARRYEVESKKLEAEAKAKAEIEMQQKEIEENRIRTSLAAMESERKEKAWKAYYKPSAGCTADKNSSLVTCGNEYIKARREFEENWAKKN